MTYELDGEQYVAVAQGSGGTVMLTIGDELKRNKGKPKQAASV